MKTNLSLVNLLFLSFLIEAKNNYNDSNINLIICFYSKDQIVPINTTRSSNSLSEINSQKATIPLNANNGFVLKDNGPFNPLSDEFALSQYNLSNIVTYSGTTSSVIYLGWPSIKQNYFNTMSNFPYTKDFGLIIMNPRVKTKQVLAYILTLESNLGWQILSPSFNADGFPGTDFRGPFEAKDYSDSIFFGHEVGPKEPGAFNTISFGNTVFGNDSGVTFPGNKANFGNTIFGKYNFSNADVVYSFKGQTPNSYVQSVANCLTFTSRDKANNPFFSSGWCNTIIGTNNVVVKPIGSQEIYEEFLVPLKSKNYNVVIGFGCLGNDSLSEVNKLNYISQNIVIGNISFRNVDESGRNILIGNENCSSYYTSNITSFDKFYENIILGNSIFWAINGNGYDFYWEGLNRNIIIIPDGFYYQDEQNMVTPTSNFTKADSIGDNTSNGIFLGTCGSEGNSVDRSFETYISNVYEGIIPKNNLTYETLNSEIIKYPCPHTVWVSNEELLGNPIPISESDYSVFAGTASPPLTFNNYTEDGQNQLNIWLNEMLYNLPIFGVLVTDYPRYADDTKDCPQNSAIFAIDSKKYFCCKNLTYKNDYINCSSETCPFQLSQQENFLYYITRIPPYNITRDPADKFKANGIETTLGPFEFSYLTPLIIYCLQQYIPKIISLKNDFNILNNNLNILKDSFNNLNIKYDNSKREIEDLKNQVLLLKNTIEKIQSL